MENCRIIPSTYGTVFIMETHHSVLFQSAEDLNNIEDKTIDLVVTSPPYPMIEMWDAVFIDRNNEIDEYMQKGDGCGAFELMHRVLDRVWKECYRVLRPGGFACINIGDATRKINTNFRLYTNHSRITALCESIGFQSLPPVLWRKQSNAPNKFMGSGMLPSGAYVTLEHEYILIFRKSDKRVFKNDEKEVRQRSSFFWEERNVWFSDIWDFKGTRQALGTKQAMGAGKALGDSKMRSRSGAFPFELAFRLIQMYSMQGDTVLDPFLGTGTTTAASIASARNSIGVELDDNFTTTIEQSITGSVELANQRQRKRINDHRDFVKEYENKKNKTMKYVNGPHGLPVMTKQELKLMVPKLKKIVKREDGVYTAHHGPMNSEGFLIDF